MGELAVIARNEQGRFLPGTAPGPGRDTIYSQEIADTICQALTDGATLRYAAMAAGISHQALYEWIQNVAGFGDSIARAQAACHVRMAANLTKAADGDPAYKGNPNMAVEYLKRRDRAEWGDTLDIRKADTDTLRELLQAQSDAATIYEPIEPGEDDL